MQELGMLRRMWKNAPFIILHLLSLVKFNRPAVLIIQPKRFCSDVSEAVETALADIDAHPSILRSIERSNSSLLLVWKDFVSAFQKSIQSSVFLDHHFTHRLSSPVKIAWYIHSPAL